MEVIFIRGLLLISQTKGQLEVHHVNVWANPRHEHNYEHYQNSSFI